MTNQTWDSEGMVFRDFLGPLLDRLWWIFPYEIPFFVFSMIVILSYYYLTHLRFDMEIAFGSDFPGKYNFSSEGWIWTKGEKGVVEYTGVWYGLLGKKIVYYETMVNVVYSYVGITGFSGYLFGLGRTFERYPVFFVGYADHVCLEPVG